MNSDFASIEVPSFIDNVKNGIDVRFGFYRLNESSPSVIYRVDRIVFMEIFDYPAATIFPTPENVPTFNHALQTD
jgi:hypothetical protein